MRQYLSFCHRRKSVYDSLQSRAASTSKTKLLNCEFIKYVVAWWSNIKALRTKLIRWVPINFSHLPTVQNFTLSSCQNILLLSSRVHHCSIISRIASFFLGKPYFLPRLCPWAPLELPSSTSPEDPLPKSMIRPCSTMTQPICHQRICHCLIQQRTLIQQWIIKVKCLYLYSALSWATQL